jgi:hypothetical protein
MMYIQETHLDAKLEVCMDSLEFEGFQLLVPILNSLHSCDLGALHTKVTNQVDKGFWQVDWLRSKVCLLGLNTIGQRLTRNTFCNYCSNFCEIWCQEFV